MRTLTSVLLFCSLILSSAVLAKDESDSPSMRDWDFNSAEMIPIQNGGRVKPIGAFARHTVLFITGRETWKGWDPVDLMFSWVTQPKEWEAIPLIKIAHPEVKRQLLIDEKRKYFSAAELFGNNVLRQYADGLSAGEERTTKEAGPRVGSREAELNATFNRMMTFRSIISGEIWTVIPSVPPAKWGSLVMNDENMNPALSDLRDEMATLVRAYYKSEQKDFEDLSATISKKLIGEAEKSEAGLGAALNAEMLYLRTNPFGISWILYLLAGILFYGAFAMGEAGRGYWVGKAAWVAMLLGFITHTAGFALRIYVSGRPPVSNMYETLIWVAYGVLIFAFVLYFQKRDKIILSVAGFVGAFCLLSGESAPAIMDPGIHTLVPVLRSNLWLTIHVLSITLSYAAFALGLGLSNVALFHYFGSRTGATKKIENLNQLTYRATQFGVVLLAAGTILGGVWADYSWGRFWGWDPKETWALITLLVYVAILHGRLSGWVGQFGFPAVSVLAFLSVVMAWYGVNFVLGVGLHSYGFSAGGAEIVGAFCLVQGAYVAAAYIARKQKG